MVDHVGQQLGNYRLVRLLGRGGFAEVYLGQHVRLPSQRAAIKILATRINPEDVQKFEHEADTIASLTHPHIVRLLDFDVVDGMPFLVMEYAPNGSLRHRHRGGQVVSLHTVVEYVQQVAEALDYAHYKHLIHRDIKPDNMLLDECHQILLSDFGVATIAHNTTSQSAQAVIGTVAYMAPEQFQEYPRPASDQYALAVTVYEWLTGTRPFHGTFTEIAVKHALVPPPPLRCKNPALSPEVEQVVLTALAKDPKMRFANVRAFANALEVASEDQGLRLFTLSPCAEVPSGPAPERESSSAQFSATIPPREYPGDMSLGTATVPLTQPVEATMPVPTSAAELVTPEERITPASDELRPVETPAAPSSPSGRHLRPVRQRITTSGGKSRRPLIGVLMKRLAHRSA
ncbi:MAG TPA: protein kinase [Ktedonobacteraceae bacterium]|nr:protein kinase [Ktedonobacteraceae bacterium]